MNATGIKIFIFHGILSFTVYGGALLDVHSPPTTHNTDTSVHGVFDNNIYFLFINVLHCL